MSALVIEKGVPIPPSRIKSELAEYVRAMEIGDSIYREQAQGSLLTQFKSAARSFKFTSRVEGKGTRIWRIA